MTTRANVTRKGWSLDELALTFGVNKRFRAQEVNAGRLHAKRLGRRIVVVDEDLQAFLSRRNVRPVDISLAKPEVAVR